MWHPRHSADMCSVLSEMWHVRHLLLDLHLHLLFLLLCLGATNHLAGMVKKCRLCTVHLFFFILSLTLACASTRTAVFVAGRGCSGSLNNASIFRLLYNV